MPNEIDLDIAYQKSLEGLDKYGGQTKLSVLTGEAGERLGIVPVQSKGVLTDSVNAADRSLADIRSSFLNTFSKFGATWAKDWGEQLAARTSSNPDIYTRPVDQGFVASAVEGIVASSPAIAASALGLGWSSVAGLAIQTAGKIGTGSAFSTIFAQTLGDAKDEVDYLSEGKLTPSEAWGWAMGKSIIQAGSESWFGLETRLGLGLNQAAKAITGRMAAKEGGQLTLEKLGRYAIGRPWIGGIKSAGWGSLKEIGEEVVAGTFDTAANQIISEEDLNASDMLAEGFRQGWDAIPSVVAMVGLGTLVKTQERQNLKSSILHGLGNEEAQKSKQEALYGEKQGDAFVINQDLVQQENDRIQAIRDDWVDKGILNKQDAEQAGELIRTVSRNIALMNRANGQNPNATPIEMIDTQLTSLVNIDPSGRNGLTRSDMSELLNKFKQGESSNDMLSFIIKKNPSFASTLNNILDSSQAITIERENNSYKNHLEDRIGIKRDQAISDSYRQLLSQRASLFIKEGQVPNVLSPQETKAILPFGAFRSLYAEPITGVKIGLGSYTAYVRGGSLVFKPEFTVKQTEKATTFKSLSGLAVAKQASQIESEIISEQSRVADEIASQIETDAAKTSVESPLTLKLRQSEQTISEQSQEQASSEALPKPKPTSRTRLVKAYSENIRLKNAVNDYDGLENFYNNIKPDPLPTKQKEEIKKEKPYALGRPISSQEPEGKLPNISIAENVNQESHRETRIREMKERVANAKNHKRPLAQMDEQLKGLYLPDYLLTIYFTGADASTIVEEWFHHITTNQLLPSEFERILTEAYGNDDEKKDGYIQTNATHEKVAQNLLNYIRNGIVNQAEVVSSFNWLRDALSQTEDNIKETTVGADFKKLFTPVEDTSIYGENIQESASEAGDVAADSMRSNPASLENFDTLVEQTIEDIDNLPDDFFESDDFKGPLAQIGIPKEAGKISGNFSKNQSIKFKKIASKLFPELGEVTSLNQLGLNSEGLYNKELHKARITKLNRYVAQASRSINIKRAKWSDSRTTKEAENIIEQAKKELDKLPDVPDALGYAADGGPLVWQWFKQAASSVYSFGARWLNYLDTGFNYLALNNKDSVFMSLSNELLDSDLKAKGLDDKYAEEASKVYGDLNRYDDVELDGRDYTVTEAMGLYVFSNGQKMNFTSNEQAIRLLGEKNSKGTISDVEWGQLALLLSNRVRGNIVTVKAINDAVDFIKSNNKLLNIIDWTQRKMGGNHALSKAVAKELMGIEVGTIKGLYMTFEREGGSVSDDKIMATIGQEGVEFTGRAGVGPLFTMQSRRQLEGEPLRLDYLSSVDGYMARTNHFMTHAESVKKILMVLSDKGLRDSIYKKFGDISTINTMIEQTKAALSPWGKVERAKGDPFLAKLRTGISMAGIGLKPWISWLNYLSFISSMGDMDVKMAMKNFYDTLSYVNRQSFTKKNMFGLKLTAHPLEGMPEWEDLRKLSPLIDDLPADIEQYEALKRPIGNIDKMINSLGIARNRAELAYSLHRRADIISRFSIFKTVYEFQKQLLLKENPSMSPQEASGKAVRLAEKEAIKYIPINLSSRKSYFQESSEVRRIFAPFSTQTIQFLNAYMKDFVIPFVAAYKTAKGGEGQRIVSGLKGLATKENLRRALWSIVIPSFIYSWLQRKRLPDEEEFLRDIVLYPVGMIPIVGNPIQSMATYGQKQVRLSPIIGLNDLQISANAALEMYRAATGDDTIRDYVKVLTDASSLPSDLLGIPKYITRTTPQAIQAFVNEDDMEKASKKFLQHMLLGGEPIKNRK